MLLFFGRAAVTDNCGWAVLELVEVEKRRAKK
jgi:hypothetical protein